MLFIKEERERRLGGEHPYTLLAKLYLARIKSELGQHRDAEMIIRNGLDIAIRNLGEAHIGVLLANTIYAEVLARLGRFAESENIFYKLIDKAQYKRLADEDGDHPDRLTNILFLSQCLEDQGKLKQALEMCEQFLVGIAAIGGQGRGMTHKILPRMRARVARLEDELRRSTGESVAKSEKG
ncbi:hypothetical protein F5Y03DRAFT_400597 [Xylaria venustula]|nr:hypothetical protein F5Y03DRAFT_400597 [Xylaria venustula]